MRLPLSEVLTSFHGGDAAIVTRVGDVDADGHRVTLDAKFSAYEGNNPLNLQQIPSGLNGIFQVFGRGRGDDRPVRHVLRKFQAVLKHIFSRRHKNLSKVLNKKVNLR